MSDENKRKRPRGTGQSTNSPAYAFGGSVITMPTGKAYANRARARRSLTQNLLKTKMGEVASGNFASPKVQRISAADLLEAVLTDYRNNSKCLSGRRRTGNFILSRTGHMRASNIGTDQLSNYIASRSREGGQWNDQRIGHVTASSGL